jgi:hypothetical protein
MEANHRPSPARLLARAARSSALRYTAALRAALLAAFELSGGTPLDVMVSVIRNPALPLQLHFNAAVKAARFHPKLAPIEHGSKVELGLGARLEAATKRDEEDRANGEERAFGHPAP